MDPRPRRHDRQSTARDRRSPAHDRQSPSGDLQSLEAPQISGRSRTGHGRKAPRKERFHHPLCPITCSPTRSHCPAAPFPEHSPPRYASARVLRRFTLSLPPKRRPTPKRKTERRLNAPSMRTKNSSPPRVDNAVHHPRHRQHPSPAAPESPDALRQLQLQPHTTPLQALELLVCHLSRIPPGRTARLLDLIDLKIRRQPRLAGVMLPAPDRRVAP